MKNETPASREGVSALVVKWRADAHLLRTTEPVSAFAEERADAREEDADELEAALLAATAQPAIGTMAVDVRFGQRTYHAEFPDAYEYPRLYDDLIRHLANLTDPDGAASRSPTPEPPK